MLDRTRDPVDCYSEIGSFHSTLGVEGPGRWDCNRELRVLRDAATRSHAEEASALRRSAEEYERCALRCQMDESVALHNFLAGLHEAMETRLERQRQQCTGRLEALEQRLDVEAGRLERIRSDFAVEARRAVQEALQKLEQCIEGGPGSARDEGQGEEDDAGDARNLGSASEGMAKVGADLKAAAEAVARDIARQVASMACADLRGELAPRTDRCQEELLALNFKAEAAEDRAGAVGHEAHAAVNRLEELRSLVELQYPSLEDKLLELERHTSGGLSCAEASTAGLRASLKEAESQTNKANAKLIECLSGCEDEVSSMAAQYREVSESVQAAECHAQLRSQKLADECGVELSAMNSLVLAEIQRLDKHYDDESRSMRVVHSNIEELSAGMDCAIVDAVKAATGGTHTLVSALEANLFALRDDLAASKSCFESLEGELAAQQRATAGDRRETEGEFAELQRETRNLGEECERAARHADFAWRPESVHLSAELVELRHQLASTSERWQASTTENALSLDSVSSNFEKLTNELASKLTNIEQQGLSHEWSIPKCIQRLQYLSMDGDSGVWLDSPEFQLGCLGPLVLRLYPRGIARSDGFCAVGLHAQATCPKGTALPLRLDLSLAGLARRANAVRQDSGSLLWLATGFGSLADLLGNNEDLTVGVEIPCAPWATIGSLTQEESPRALAQATLTSSARGSVQCGTSTPAPAAAAVAGASLHCTGATRAEDLPAQKEAQDSKYLPDAAAESPAQTQPTSGPTKQPSGNTLAGEPRGAVGYPPAAYVPASSSLDNTAICQRPQNPNTLAAAASAPDPAELNASCPHAEAAAGSTPSEPPSSSRSGVPRPSSTSRLARSRVNQPQGAAGLADVPRRPSSGNLAVGGSPGHLMPGASSPSRTGWTLFGNEPLMTQERQNSEEERVSLREDLLSAGLPNARVAQSAMDGISSDRTWVAELRQALGSIDAAAAARGTTSTVAAAGRPVRGAESAPSTPLSRTRVPERRLPSTNPFDL